MAPRKSPRREAGSWSKLSASTRARYAGAGVSRMDYYRGVSLQGARGHKPKAPSGAAPKAATDRLVAGEASESDIRAVQNWADTLGDKRWASWIPSDMSIDAKAALSQIDLHPSQWGHASMTPRSDGQPWTLTVTPKNAPQNADGTSPYDRSIDVPGGGGADTDGAREIIDWWAYGDDDYWWDDFDFDIGESE